MDYHIATGYGAADLALEVNKLICEGWVPVGGVAVEPTDEQLAEMFAEAGVHVERDFLNDALNSGDGTYRP